MLFGLRTSIMEWCNQLIIDVWERSFLASLILTARRLPALQHAVLCKHAAAWGFCCSSSSMCCI